MQKQKFAFSTDHETISENLGISESRHDEFFEAAKEVSFRAFVSDESITDRSQAIEIFLNQVQPQNEIDFFWSGCVFGDVQNQMEKMCEKMSALLTKAST